MKTKFTPIAPLLAALLLLSACAAGKPAPRNPAPVEEQPGGIYTARTAAQLHIVSPGGRIKIGNLEIDNGKPSLIAQADSPVTQCPFPAAPAAPAPAAGRETRPAPAGSSGGDVESEAVTEQAERTDAAAVGEYREPENPGRTLKVPKRK